MNQHAASRTGGEVRLDRATAWLRRLAPALVIFVIAFAVDIATGQRYSSVWGSLAILASVVAVFPVVRPALGALCAYAGVWLAFNLVRAVADDTGVALAGRDTVSGWERAVFGELPSAWLQDRFLDPSRTRAFDVGLSLVHGSFFAVPFVMAAALWWRRRLLFRRYTVATAVTFGMGLLGFLLLPTAPPWMFAPSEVTRITHQMLAGSALSRPGSGEGFWFEPNALAALPSIHVAATVLIFLTARHFGRWAGLAGAIYALVMTVAVVYLGEHYVMDALLGWVAVGVGWRIALGRPCGQVLASWR